MITELYVKLTAMLLNHWLVARGAGEEARGMLKLGQLVCDSTAMLGRGG